MPAPVSAKLKKWLSAVLFILAGLLVIICSLPIVTEQFILPSFLRKSGLAQYKVSICRLGLNGCTLQISGKQGFGSVISAGNIQANWSLSGLLERKVDSLLFHGLHINYARPGHQRKTLQAPPVKQKTGQTDDQPGTDPLLFVVEQIQVTDSFFTFQSKSGPHSLPFSVSAHRVKDKEDRGEDFTLRYKVSANSGDHEVTADISYLPREQSLSGHLAGSIDLQRLARESLLKIPASVDIEGRVDVKILADMQVAPFSLGNLQAEALFQDFLFNFDKLSVHGVEDQPPVISLRNSDQGFLLEAGELFIDGPLKAAAKFDALAKYGAGTLQWHGNLHVKPTAGQVIGAEYELTQAPSLTLKHEGAFLDKKVQVKIITIKNMGDTREKVIVEQDALRINVDHLGIESQWLFDLDQSPFLSADLLLRSDGLRIISKGVQFTVPQVQLTGGGTFLEQNSKKGYALSGKLELSDSSLELEDQKVSLKGINLELPVSWPLQEESGAGVVQIQKILLRDTEIGNFYGTWKQLSDVITLNGKLHGSLIPEGMAVVNGTLRFPGNKLPLGDFWFGTPDTPVSMEHLIPIVPALDSFSGSGLLNMKGRVTVHPDRVAGNLSIGFHEGTFEVPKAKLKAEGVRFNIEFPGLPTLSTSPEQKLSIDRFVSNKLMVTDIKSNFQLESPGSFFIEKISGRWSGGRIFTSSFRLQKENQDFEAALLCDRLELAEILSQLGLAEAEGRGKLSGRVPVRFSEGNFYVDDGFLYTTPGETGTLEIKKSEHLAAGIPADVPQFSPLLFASAALRDFQYNWAKLLISSQEENLLLQLQIDGKPTDVLPYRFDTHKNAFVRLSEKEGGGIDQPIKLDVNFNVPLNELLEYHKTIQPILRNIR